MATRRRLFAPFIGAVLVLAVSVGPAAALTPVSVVGCHGNLGGERHITPDHVTITGSWGAKTRGQIQSALRWITWNVTIDGTPVDVTPYIGEPYRSGDFLWITWAYPYGDMDFGEQVTATVEYVFDKPVFDGDLIYVGSLGPFSCTVIADLT
jgi:hypothetical protein